MANSSVLENSEFDTVPATTKKYRVQLDFSADDFREINRLVEKLSVGTRAELFRSALVVLRWMYNKKRSGYSVVAMSPNEERLIEPEFPFFDNLTCEPSSPNRDLNGVSS